MPVAAQKTYGGKLNLLDDVAQALKNVGRP